MLKTIRIQKVGGREIHWSMWDEQCRALVGLQTGEGGTPTEPEEQEGRVEEGEEVDGDETIYSLEWLWIGNEEGGGRPAE